jgi:hypothetical protein
VRDLKIELDYPEEGLNCRQMIRASGSCEKAPYLSDTSSRSHFESTAHGGNWARRVFGPVEHLRAMLHQINLCSWWSKGQKS